MNCDIRARDGREAGVIDSENGRVKVFIRSWAGGTRGSKGRPVGTYVRKR